MLNNTKKMRMMTTTTMNSSVGSQPRRSAYELLSKKTIHGHEQHYCSSEVEIMEPDTYGGMSMNSNTILPTLLSPPAPPSISSSTTVNFDTYSSTRRQSLKKRNSEGNSSIPMPPINNPDERIEVKILPQDDHWGETTGTTNPIITPPVIHEDTLTNNNDVSLHMNESIHIHGSYQQLSEPRHKRSFSMKLARFALYLLLIVASISPVLFLSLPYALIKSDTILIDDYTPLIPILFKMILLLIGTLALLYRRRNVTCLPLVQFHQLCLTILLLLILCTYWFYYIFQFLLPIVEKYDRILSMTSSYVDILIIDLLLTVLLLEIRWLYPRWIVKVVRSPDGQTRQYTIGSMSIQEASVYLLEQYYKDFPVFNPWLENAQQSMSKRHGTLSNKSIGSQSNSSTIATGTNGNSRSMRATHDRFYDELDYERRVRKRRSKLLSSCEDAFTHVRKCFNEKTGSNVPMDAREAAQAVFSSMSRSLQKYLRITRQQPYFTRESIISHLATCLTYDLSPRAFLERYTEIDAQPLATLLFPAIGSINEQSWTITCDPHVDKENHPSPAMNRSIYSNLTVVLKQQQAEHIALICTFYAMPRVYLLEKFFDFKQNQFVLKLNSETSV